MKKRYGYGIVGRADRRRWQLRNVVTNRYMENRCFFVRFGEVGNKKPRKDQGR